MSNRFDASVHSGDVASIERFFKIFPLLGQHEEGLTKFAKYLASKVGGCLFYFLIFKIENQTLNTGPFFELFTFKDYTF